MGRLTKTWLMFMLIVIAAFIVNGKPDAGTFLLFAAAGIAFMADIFFSEKKAKYDQ